MGKIDAQRIDFSLPDSPDQPVFVLRASKDQSANIIEFRDAEGRIACGIGPDGNLLNVVESRPPAGHYRVKNLYVDRDTGKLVVEFDDGS